jgi:hypothetical protein
VSFRKRWQRQRLIELPSLLPIKHLSVKVAIAVCSPLFQLFTTKSYEATLRIQVELVKTQPGVVSWRLWLRGWPSIGMP